MALILSSSRACSACQGINASSVVFKVSLTRFVDWASLFLVTLSVVCGQGLWFNQISNHDGKTDIGEEYIACRIFEECTGGFDSGRRSSPDDDDEKDYSWRLCCEDGSRFGVDPEDYETEDEYNEALAEARADDDDYDDDNDDNDYDDDDDNDEIDLSLYIEFPDTIKGSDFPNKRRYNAACALEGESLICCNEEEAARCRFILEKADVVLAANYLSYEDGFLYAQAIKDNFALPVSLPDEDEAREFDFYQAISRR